MILYALYRIGYFLAIVLPVRVSYGMARILGLLCYCIYSSERKAIKSNLKAVIGPSCDEAELKRLAKNVFINFAKYLVVFFRFSRVDENYLKRFCRVDDIANVDEGLAKGKGVILLSAHIGNWELGGFVMASLRQPTAAVVLTHANKKINDFFKRQRHLGNLKPIEINFALRECFKILKNNGLLAMLGDRDFSKNGIYTKFFGRPALIPKGPAVFSCRLGSAVVPVFMVRQPDGMFHLVFEKPIYPAGGCDEDACVKKMVEQYTSVIETYVKRYPDQWYMFREVWNNNG